MRLLSSSADVRPAGAQRMSVFLDFDSTYVLPEEVEEALGLLLVRSPDEVVDTARSGDHMRDVERVIGLPVFRAADEDEILAIYRHLKVRYTTADSLLIAFE